MKKYCHRCRTRLRVREIKCPYCHESAMGWLHYMVIAAFGATTIFYLLK
jgi:RNA polymerase subunit RPABC4/transcription elongation factor Spt4